jgi:galactose mutarotase-like enzyme
MDQTILLARPGGDLAGINPFGAELHRWRARGVDLIRELDEAVWDRTAPVLFPVVGWTRNGEIRVDGQTYPLGLHGFAWRKRFTVVERREDFVQLLLTDDDETRTLYPFAFRFEVTFRLGDGWLENALIVSNSGNRPLPYACGLHPGFRWPLAGSNAPHALYFEKTERPEVPIIAPGGLFSKAMRPIPLEGGALPLDPALFANEALCFLNIASKNLAFDNGSGARLHVGLEDFPHVGLWTRPPAPYLCIEPWTGHGDPSDFTGDLCDKPSMRLLAPGAVARHAATFSLEGEIQPVEGLK